MKITVEQRHIDAAVRPSCNRCPIALALNEQIPSEDGWIVNCLSVRRMWDHEERIDLPGNAGEFVKEYDAGRPVEPFAFTITLPEETTNEAAIQG